MCGGVTCEATGNFRPDPAQDEACHTQFGPNSMPNPFLHEGVLTAKYSKLVRSGVKTPLEIKKKHRRKKYDLLTINGL